MSLSFLVMCCFAIVIVNFVAMAVLKLGLRLLLSGLARRRARERERDQQRPRHDLAMFHAWPRTTVLRVLQQKQQQQPKAILSFIQAQPRSITTLAASTSWRSTSSASASSNPGRGGRRQQHARFGVFTAASALVTLAAVALPGHVRLRTEAAEEQPQRREQIQQLPADRELERERQRNRSWLRRLWNVLDNHILEPLSTFRRFVVLALLFLPVILTSPILLRQALPHQQDPPSVRWWYSLLVKQMERAGPTFIKASADNALGSHSVAPLYAR